MPVTLEALQTTGLLRKIKVMVESNEGGVKQTYPGELEFKGMAWKAKRAVGRVKVNLWFKQCNKRNV